MIVTLQDARTSDIPLATITTLVPALALLMLLPSLIAMLLAIA
ncbi:putative membrane protein [Raoultella ornithinolytica 2-156-04_S1_C2]|nr:putative membrane protein [Raoultella ornithinolytica 2-156-04_S1_C1]KDX13128.1 putative membrane protein [Raoultella ornithinolytica 2-156-04_S1_C2]